MKRNYGLDYCRIILCVMIIIIHMTSKTYGQIASGLNINTIQYFICWFILALCYVGVNGFAILSGYLSYGRDHKFKKILYLYLQLLFYSIFITLIITIIYNEKITMKIIFETIFPLNSKRWWYINLYICISFFMPYLDKFVDNINYKEFKNFVMIVFFLFSISNLVFVQNDIFYLNNGFSLVWIIIMYIIGAGIKKFKIGVHKKFLDYILIYFLLSFITVLSRILIDNFTLLMFNKSIGSGLLYTYISPTIFPASIYFFLSFINLKSLNLPKFNNTIVKISKSSLASYIIHVHPLFLKYFITAKFIYIGKSDFLLQIFYTLFIACIIFILSIFIDFLRIGILELFTSKKN